MKLINNFFKYIVSISIIITTLLTVVDFCCFDKQFYYSQYEKNNTKEVVKTDNSNLIKITDNLLDYLRNKNDDINITYLKNGEETNVYQDIEIIHMSYVKDLYQNVVVFRNVLAIISIIGICYLLINKISFRKEFNCSVFLIVLVILLIGISCIIDFNSFWFSFHKVFFTKNDYWLLDPNTCILVNLFTSEFFFSLCTKICIITIIVILLLIFIINLYEKKKYS